MRRLKKPLFSLLWGVAFLLVLELLVRMWGGAPSILTLQPRIWDLPGGDAENMFTDVEPKRPGTFRIAAFGASTVKGWPFEEKYSFANLLEPLFAELGLEVEVVNLAFNSIDAGLVADVVERAERVNADLYLVATIHNEFANRIFWKRPPDLPFKLASHSELVRTVAGPFISRRLREIDTKQALFKALEDLTNKTSEELGKPTFGHLPIQAFERAPYLERYEASLRRIVATARAHDVPLVFAELVENLREYAPIFRTPEASEAYTTGRSLLDRGAIGEARSAFERSRDTDGAPIRLTGDLLEILRTVARDESVPLVPVREYVDAASEHGIPGFDTMIDMLHPTSDGHAEIAVGTLHFLVDHGLVPPIDESKLGSLGDVIRAAAMPDGEKRTMRQRSHHYTGVIYVAAGNVEAGREQLEIAVERWGSEEPATLRLLELIRGD